MPMPPPTEDDSGFERLLAVHHADFALLEVLVALGRVHERRPDEMGSAQKAVAAAIAVAGLCHRRGGCTSGQLKELDLIKAKLQAVAG